MVATLKLYSVANGGARPEFGTLEIAVRDGVRNAPDDFGSVRARQLLEYSTRRWELVWDEANRGQVEFVEWCFDQSLGGVLPMAFTPYGDVDGNAINVIFVADTFSVEGVGPLRWRMRVVIEEAI